MRELDESRLLSEQDFGGFLEVATLYEDEEGLTLVVEAGYGPEGHNVSREYRLDKRPAQPLDAFASETWLDPSTDQSEDLAKLLGVSVTALPPKPLTF